MFLALEGFGDSIASYGAGPTATGGGGVRVGRRESRVEWAHGFWG